MSGWKGFKAVLAIVFLVGASLQARGYLSESEIDQSGQARIDVQAFLQDIHVDLESELAQPEKLARLEQALAQVDEALDLGAQDDLELLQTRDALVEMRREVLDQQPQKLTAQMQIPSLGIGNNLLTRGGTGFGGGVGGGGALGGASGLLPLGAAITAVVVPATVATDDDEPGTAASN